MKLKDGIELFGYDNQSEVHMELDFNSNGVLYSGKLSEVSEEQASEWVERKKHLYKDYNFNWFNYTRALLSIGTATNKEWIIITKTKKELGI